MKQNTVLYSIIAVLVVAVLLFLMSLSEGNKGGQKVYDPQAEGADGEVVLVVPDDTMDQLIGDSVQSVFTRTMPGLPPPSQPYFDVVRVKGSELGGLLQEHRKIFMVDLSSQYEHPARLGFGENEWAKGQILFRLTGNNRDSMLHHFSERSERILDRFEKEEREHRMKKFEEDHSVKLRKMLRKDHQLSLKVHKEFELEKNKERFVWLERYQQIPRGGRKRDLMHGILIYHRPYEGKGQFEKEQLLNTRDSILKKYVPGPSEGSYMATEDRFPEVSPRLKEINFNGEYAVEMRGLWRVENDQMGGPFLSLSTYDKERDRLVTVEGFVYGPRFDKRSEIREIEAMIYTLGFVDKKSS